MRRIPAALTLGMTALIGTSCGMFDDDDDDDDRDGPIQEVQENVMNLLREPGQMGRWEASCQGEAPLGASFKEELMFRGNNLEQVFVFYNQDNCQEPAVRLLYDGEFTLEDEPEDRDNYTVAEWYIDDATIEVLSTEGARMLSEQKFCGIETWTAGEDRSVDDLIGQQGCDQLPTAPRVEYELINVQDDRLYLAFPGLATMLDAAQVPQDVSRDIFYQKL